MPQKPEMVDLCMMIGEVQYGLYEVIFIISLVML